MDAATMFRHGTEIDLMLRRKWLSLPTTCTPRSCPVQATMERQRDADAFGTDLIAGCMF